MHVAVYKYLLFFICLLNLNIACSQTEMEIGTCDNGCHPNIQNDPLTLDWIVNTFPLGTPDILVFNPSGAQGH